MESTILDTDKDEWIYTSMNKYSNLSMYELEWPVDALELVGNASICLSGVQQYSGKPELIQLCIPPKLMPEEEGLCKDRDFQIVSGGYASSRITQVKALQDHGLGDDKELVVCVQSGEDGVTLYELGNSQTAVIKERCKLTVPSSSRTPTFGLVHTSKSKVYYCTEGSGTLYEWDLGAPLNMMLQAPLKDANRITKMKFYDDHTLLLLTESGSILSHDLRQKEGGFPRISSSLSGSETLYSFDTLPSSKPHRLTIIDSLGGYETFDVRNPSCPQSRTRLPIPPSSSSSGSQQGVVRDKFNLEYSPMVDSNGGFDFIVSGLKDDVVHVLREEESGGPSDPLQQQQEEQDAICSKISSKNIDNFDKFTLRPVFVHDGHTRMVSTAAYAKSVERLVFSASVDAMLHAWQYIPQGF